jgi:hypothetical protein
VRELADILVDLRRLRVVLRRRFGVVVVVR